MFENVNGRTTDARVIGILMAHLGPFGSGELKIEQKMVGPYVRVQNLFIYFLISHPKHMLWVLNETVLSSTQKICYT